MQIYVHRSGRTARAATDGISVALISPPERPKLNALCKALGKEEGLAPFPINQAYMPAVLERVKMAIKVDSALRQQQQVSVFRLRLLICGLGMTSLEEIVVAQCF
jgi:ATP-dependent RNA helicase DDX24/MAK5